MNENDWEEIRKKAHLRGLEKSKNAKECGDLTVVPLGYVSQIVVEFLQQQREEMRRRIPALRQWLNEDRITDASKMVSSEMIEKWLLDNPPQNKNE